MSFRSDVNDEKSVSQNGLKTPFYLRIFVAPVEGCPHKNETDFDQNLDCFETLSDRPKNILRKAVMLQQLRNAEFIKFDES